LAFIGAGVFVFPLATGFFNGAAAFGPFADLAAWLVTEDAAPDAAGEAALRRGRALRADPEDVTLDSF
jgi:hypothetical protein